MPGNPKRIYRLYIDESGDHRYGKRTTAVSRVNLKEKKIEIPSDEYAELGDFRKRYLSLTGCIIESGYYDKIFCPEMEKLKRKHFAYHPDDPVIFHREDMVNKRGSFWILTDQGRKAEFDASLLAFFGKMEYFVITVVLDKKAHIEKYGRAAYHPYHYCVMAMLERYCGLLNFLNARGDVLAESRGGSEDEELKGAYQGFYSRGTRYWKKTHFQNVLTSREIKLKKKGQNIPGLQLADLLAHPLKMYSLSRYNLIAEQNDFGSTICTQVEGKFNRNFSTGIIKGYGIVFL